MHSTASLIILADSKIIMPTILTMLYRFGKDHTSKSYSLLVSGQMLPSCANGTVTVL